MKQNSKNCVIVQILFVSIKFHHQVSLSQSDRRECSGCCIQMSCFNALHVVIGDLLDSSVCVLLTFGTNGWINSLKVSFTILTPFHFLSLH